MLVACVLCLGTCHVAMFNGYEAVSSVHAMHATVLATVLATAPLQQFGVQLVSEMAV
jgi:hypothetical protein